MRRIIFSSTMAFMLAGCATTSFAPPIVNMQDELQSKRSQTFFNAICTPDPVPVAGGHKRDVEGALRLINNYILTYRCQRDRAAEGRQFFEVPGFLATAGGAIAAAFGAPAAVAIGSGAASAILGQGKSYYAPKDKAVVLSDGLRGILCIHNEAVGIDAPTLKAISGVQENSVTAPPPPAEPVAAAAGATGTPPPATDDEPAVGISSQRQYFNMIATALWSVEQVVASRLSDAGKQFDMSGVMAELEKLKKEEADKEAKAGTPEAAAKPVTEAKPPQAPANATNAERNSTDVRARNFSMAKASLSQFDPTQVGLTMIQLKTLKPKLDQCVVQTKV